MRYLPWASVETNAPYAPTARRGSGPSSPTQSWPAIPVKVIQSVPRASFPSTLPSRKQRCVTNRDSRGAGSWCIVRGSALSRMPSRKPSRFSERLMSAGR